MTTLAEIRKKLSEQAAKASGEGRQTKSDGLLYPFWNMETNKESTIRFLPDGDNNNTFFWVERQLINLTFAGIAGEANSKPVTIKVPCMEMYGDVCPILSEVRGWFKDPSLNDLGRKYWKKKSYIYHGFVVEDGLGETEVPENPIRRFVMGPQIYKLIESALIDPELDDLPTDFVHGIDFKLVKGKKGDYADYSTSKWSRRERPLSEAEQAAIEKYGLPNLRDALPKKPGEAELRVIVEMFQASVDGEPFDNERWGQYYRPYGVEAPTGNASSAPAPQREEVARPVVQPKVEVAPTPAPQVEQPAAPAGDSKAADILALIRSRQKSQ